MHGATIKIISDVLRCINFGDVAGFHLTHPLTYGFSTATMVARTHLNFMLHVHCLSC